MAQCRCQPVHHFALRAGRVVHTNIERGRCGELSDVPQDSNAILFVNSVGIARRWVCAGATRANPADEAVPLWPVDTGKSYDNGYAGMTPKACFGLKEAPAGKAGRLGHAGFVDPFALILPVDTGTGDENDAGTRIPGCRKGLKQSC